MTPLEDTADAETGVPLEIRRECMECAVSNGRISYPWLLRLYKRGAAEASLTLSQHNQTLRESLNLAHDALEKLDTEHVALSLQLEEAQAEMHALRLRVVRLHSWNSDDLDIRHRQVVLSTDLIAALDGPDHAEASRGEVPPCPVLLDVRGETLQPEVITICLEEKNDEEDLARGGTKG